ncbi:MAG: NAD-dependent epimerase/dehydratase family protein [Acidobacteriota bacterium]|nr:NAD-dependent epimerase/dehydratase family protein [Acidobacteriota bacterium]
MKHVALVTGGAGAIGSRLAAELLRRDFEVVVLDDLSSGYPENVPEGARFVEGSVTDLGLLDRLFTDHGFTYVFHLAALFANQNSVDHPVQDLEINGGGTLALLERTAHAAEDLGGFQRFLYASSSCVYGNVSGAISEDQPTHATETPYAITKFLGEQYLQFFMEHYGLPGTIVRPFNSYGPGERPGRYRNVIPNFIKLALRGDPLNITGEGNETRDFTFNGDTVAGIVGAATSSASQGKAYNLATGQETKIIDLAKQIIRLSDSTSEIRFTGRRSWDQVTSRCGSITRAREDFGYTPSTSLEEGLRLTIDWIRSLAP